jgi:hypothetical protein
MSTDDGHTDTGAEVSALRDEVKRLRDLVGPDEMDYHRLKVELWAARDAVIGSEAENGTLRAEVRQLRHAANYATERPDLRATRTWKAGRAVLAPVRAVKRLLGMPVA